MSLLLARRGSLHTPRPSGGTNLLTGDAASFTSGIADWNQSAGNANFTLAHDTVDGGVLSAAVTTSTAAIAVASHPGGAGAAKVPFTEGATLTLGADCKQVSGTARDWQIRADFYDAANAAVSVNNIVASGTLTVGAYVTLSGPITGPAGATQLRLAARWISPAAGETFYLDNAYIIA